MPSKSPAQARLMRAVAHGWKPDRIKGPSKAVAKEFVEADKKYSGGFAENRYWTGGLAAMNEVNSGVPVTLKFQEGGSVWGEDPVKLDTGDFRDIVQIGPMQAEGWQWDADSSTMYPPLWNIESGGLEETILQPTTTTTTAPATTGIGTPYVGGGTYYGGWDWGGYGNYTDWVQGQLDNPPEPEAAPVRDIPGAGPTSGSFSDPIATSGGIIPRIMKSVYGGDAQSQWTPEQIAAWEAKQTAAERQSPYRDQLRAHKKRVAASLEPGASYPSSPPALADGGDGMAYIGGTPGFYDPGGPGRGGYLDAEGNYTAGAEGGYMNYQEGGTVPPKPPTGGGAPLPGHQEGANPYPPGTSRYRMWERKYHIDPPPPPPPPEPEPDPGWFSQLFGLGEEYKGRTERELENIGEARGGYMRGYRGGGHVRGYQDGGLAAAQQQAAGDLAARQSALSQPRGGIPPATGGQARRIGGIPQRWTPQQQASWRGAAGNPAARSAMSQQYRQRQAMQNRAPAAAGRLAQMQANQQRQAGMMRPAVMPGGGQMIGGGQGLTGPWQGSPETNPMRPRGPLAPGGRPLQLPGRGGPGRWTPQQRTQWGGAGAAERGAMSQQYRQGQALRNRPGAGGITGGARVPPNMRGFLQKQRMMNRPPSNVGGGVNRVGQQDQQGALARAMQRGTGRAPTSRRSAFPGPR